MTQTNQEVGIDNAIIEMSHKTSPRAEDLIHISVGLAKKILIKHLPQSISRESISKKETTDEKIEKIMDLALDYVYVDGGHHKQYALVEIIKLIDISRLPEDIEEGIPD